MAPGLCAGVFESYLAGLMQNVGLQVAFQVADRICQGKVPGSGTFGIELFEASRQLSAVIAPEDSFVSAGLDGFQRRCLNKLAELAD
ncbi:hypothetical protein MasN3_35180 [Massilia varians]|uniref:Uncharacterized protein n=2 Tax=Massilia varians TaxID=457921 RepID=A0ABM8C9S3_9BURK|nr:hypothetical protein MasN3_35180 [Massilia varians]